MESNKKYEILTSTNVNKIYRFCKSDATNLISKMYQNILTGKLGFFRETEFFRDMSKLTEMPLDKCRHYFRKHERHIFLEILKVPAPYSHCFSRMRDQTCAKFEEEARQKKLILRPVTHYFFNQARNLRQTRISLFKQYVDGDLALTNIALSTFLTFFNPKNKNPKSIKFLKIYRQSSNPKVSKVQSLPT